MSQDDKKRVSGANNPSPVVAADPYGIKRAEANRDRLRERIRKLGELRDERLTDYEVDLLKWKYGDGLADTAIRDLLDDLDGIVPQPGSTPSPRPVERAESKDGTTRAGALSALMALEASQREDVQGWRQDVLPDGLLRFDDSLAQWIRERAATQPGDVEIIDYATPSATHIQRIAIDRGSQLDELRVIADDLAYTYRWAPYDGVIFVLTARVPIVPSIRTTIVASNRSASASSIRLEIDPYTDPKRVAAAYAELRSDAAHGRRFRLPDQRALDVVEWVARFHNGEPSADALKSWNAEMKKRKQPWKYDDLDRFRRTYREAVEKVLDPKFF